MLDSKQWCDVLSTAWRRRAALVGQQIVIVLRDVPQDQPLTTRELCERLWPEASCRGPDEIERRQKQFPSAVLKARQTLPGWWHQGEVVQRYGQEVRPYLWHSGPPIKLAEASLPKRISIHEMERRLTELEARVGALEAIQ